MAVNYEMKNTKGDICDEKSGQSQPRAQGAGPTGTKNFKCYICEMSFSTERDLNEHIRNDLIKHMIVYTGKKDDKCDICGKVFRCDGPLAKHLITHSGIKNFKCQICQMSFSAKRDLTKHMIIHTGRKDYNCHICKMSFSTQRYLTKHKITHTGICHICGKVFRREGQLTMHMVIHSGIKNFKCYICDMSFSTKRDLTKHVMSDLTKHNIFHTEKKDYKCDICERAFHDKDYLTKHMVTHETSGLASLPSQYTMVHIRSDVSAGHVSQIAEHSPSLCVDGIKEEDGEIGVKVEPGSNDLFETKDHLEEELVDTGCVKIEGQEEVEGTGCVKIEGEEDVVDTGCVKIEGEEGVTNVKKDEEEELQFEKME